MSLQNWMLNNKYTIDSPFKNDLVIAKTFDGEIIKQTDKSPLRVPKKFLLSHQENCTT